MLFLVYNLYLYQLNMFNKINKLSILCRAVTITVLLAFSGSLIGPVPVHAQELPAPGTLTGLSPQFSALPGKSWQGEISPLPLGSGGQPALLKGLKIFPDNPFRFDFILDKGDKELNPEDLKVQSNQLIKYFLASLTVPEKDLWVNLSPHEKDRIIPDAFGVTEMGRDLLAEDYILKQITSSLVFPENELGKKFWETIYAEAHTTDIPPYAFNPPHRFAVGEASPNLEGWAGKVWIVPEKAVVYENGDTAFVVEAKLKVMLEEDHNSSQFKSISENTTTQLIRQIILPEIEREVNEGANFAQLRQIYHSLILATWFKRNLKNSILGTKYVNQNKVEGVDIEDKNAKQKIYDKYLEALKKGSYDYIKEDYDPATQQIVPRKYFSGGAKFGAVNAAMVVTHDDNLFDHVDQGSLVKITGGARLAGAGNQDPAMNNTAVAEAQHPNWLSGEPSSNLIEMRRRIFGEGIDEWLERNQEARGSPEQKEKAVKLFLENKEFIDKLNQDNTDVGLEVIRLAVKDGISLGTQNLKLFFTALKKQAPQQFKNKIPIIALSLKAYVGLMSSLGVKEVQEYLNSEEYEQIPKQDKLSVLVEKLLELNLPLKSGNLGHIYSGLPSQLSKWVSKKDILRVDLSFEVFQQVREAVNDSSVQEYLDSDIFFNLTKEDKLAGLVEKILELKLPLKSQNLAHIYNALPPQLSQRVDKKDIQGVDLPLRVFRQVREAINDGRIKQYLDGRGFPLLTREIRLRALVSTIKEAGLLLDSDNMPGIYSALPWRLSKEVTKEYFISPKIVNSAYSIVNRRGKTVVFTPNLDNAMMGKKEKKSRAERRREAAAAAKNAKKTGPRDPHRRRFIRNAAIIASGVAAVGGAVIAKIVFSTEDKITIEFQLPGEAVQSMDIPLNRQKIPILIDLFKQFIDKTQDPESLNNFLNVVLSIFKANAAKDKKNADQISGELDYYAEAINFYAIPKGLIIFAQPTASSRQYKQFVLTRIINKTVDGDGLTVYDVETIPFMKLTVQGLTSALGDYSVIFPKIIEVENAKFDTIRQGLDKMNIDASQKRNNNLILGFYDQAFSNETPSSRNLLIREEHIVHEKDHQSRHRDRLKKQSFPISRETMAKARGDELNRLLEKFNELEEKRMKGTGVFLEILAELHAMVIAKRQPWSGIYNWFTNFDMDYTVFHNADALYFEVLLFLILDEGASSSLLSEIKSGRIKGKKVLEKFLRLKPKNEENLRIILEDLLEKIKSDPVVKEQKAREILTRAQEAYQVLSGVWDQVVSDAAMVGKENKEAVSDQSAVGGIDLNPEKWNLETKGQGVNLNIDPAQLQNLDIKGLTPVIFNITPMTDLPLFLGIKKDEPHKSFSPT